MGIPATPDLQDIGRDGLQPGYEDEALQVRNYWYTKLLLVR